MVLQPYLDMLLVVRYIYIDTLNCVSTCLVVGIVFLANKSQVLEDQANWIVLRKMLFTYSKILVSFLKHSDTDYSGTLLCRHP